MKIEILEHKISDSYNVLVEIQLIKNEPGDDYVLDRLGKNNYTSWEEYHPFMGYLAIQLGISKKSLIEISYNANTKTFTLETLRNAFANSKLKEFLDYFETENLGEE